MAAVTINRQKFNVSGDVREQFYNINIATTGDTLTVGMTTVLFVGFEVIGGGVTAYSVAAGSVPGQSVITITSGAQNNLDVIVYGT